MNMDNLPLLGLLALFVVAGGGLIVSMIKNWWYVRRHRQWVSHIERLAEDLASRRHQL